MRGIIVALLLCTSVVAKAEEPRYGYTYSREDVLSIVGGCTNGVFETPLGKATQPQVAFCGCIAWWIAQSVPSYEFGPMGQEATSRLFKYAGSQCRDKFPAKPQPKPQDKDKI